MNIEREPKAARFLALDYIRAVSAVLVCAGHLRAVMFVDFASIVQPTIFDKIFYFLTGLGHQSVIVFFVLSGYLVGGSILNKRDQFRVAPYAIARLTRLWVVLIPALALTALIDCCTNYIDDFVFSGRYYADWMSGPNTTFSRSPLTFIGNIMFVQTMWVPIFGTNGPLWSLFNEFWYYVTFPACVLALRHFLMRHWLSSVIPLALLVLLGSLLPIEIWPGFLVWLLGVAVWLVHQKFFIGLGQLHPVTALLSIVFFAGTLVLEKTDASKAFLPSDLVVGVGAAIMVLFAQPSVRMLPEAVDRIAIAFSEFSFSLYVIHFPIVVFVGSCMASRQLIFSGTHAACYLSILSTILIASAAFWWCFESRTQYIRSLISSGFC